MKDFLKKYLKRPLARLGLYEKSFEAYHSTYHTFVYSRNYLLSRFSKTAPILLYHRIADVSHDPIQLCVSAENFDKHVSFLKENYEIIPLSDLSKRIAENRLSGNELAITFDDGYKDNLLNAIPILEKYNVPATIFITTGHLGQQASFEWDMEYKESERAHFLSEDEIRELASNNLIEIGAHTVNHRRLSELSKEKQKEELENSKDRLEKIIGGKISLFAYPFGGMHDFNADTLSLAEEVGFSFAFANNQKLAKNGCNRYSLPRINIRDISIDNLKKLIFKV